jgi:hypothetical protein
MNAIYSAQGWNFMAYEQSYPRRLLILVTN